MQYDAHNGKSDLRPEPVSHIAHCDEAILHQRGDREREGGKEKDK